MIAPAAVLGLVLAMTATGGSVLLWLAPTWGKLRHGYEILTGSTIALLAWGAWGSMRNPVRSLEGTDQASYGELTLWLLLALTIVTALATVSLIVKLPPVIARILGIVATLAGVASFVPIASIRAVQGGAGGVAQGITELLLGATLLGAIWVGMILGHWYLVERRLSNRYMVWVAWTNVAAIVAGAGSVLLSARNPAPCGSLTGAEFEQCILMFAPILRIGSMTVILGLGVLALVALIAGFNVKLAREGGRSIQASTGMFYLAVILAPAVEFAAKVRYFS
ncbi:MAG: hypothetical protein LC679_19600 [Intrasporangiaceae bacterium]|nr:hypothetical protein [Intrasporangiaceae bacterium]